MLAGNGGSVLFYVIGHDSTLARRLVEFLQQSDFAGVIFTKQADGRNVRAGASATSKMIARRM